MRTRLSGTNHESPDVSPHMKEPSTSNTDSRPAESASQSVAPPTRLTQSESGARFHPGCQLH